MQLMVLFSLNPEIAQTPPPQELLEAEFEAVRGLYMESLIGIVLNIRCVDGRPFDRG